MLSFPWILYELFLWIFKFFFLISEYSPTSNSNINTVVTDMNNVESSIDSDSSKEVYNIINNNNRNSVVNNNNSIDGENKNINISDSENNNVSLLII